MNASSKYWTLIRIDAAEAGRGYKLQLIPSAQAFFAAYFPASRASTDAAEDTLQQRLFHLLREDKTVQPERAGAELCLRCYVSSPILQSCLKRARLFGVGNGFTYRDLLPFVLNDDGKPLQATFVPFSVEILRSFSPDHKSSLAGWADLRVRRNPELNQFLLDCGLRFSSDWALLNRANPKQMKGMDRSLVEVFHRVYRRDRLQQHRQGHRQKCLDPTHEQLLEMIQGLRQQQVLIHSIRSLLDQLKRVASELRQEEIWGRRGSPVTDSLELTDPETGETTLREIPDTSSGTDLEIDEQSELQQFCHEQLLTSLDQAIRQAIGDRIHNLEQRPRYTHLAHQVKPALRLLYFEGKSQRQIASVLGMTNQSQVSRVLNPKELLVIIRQRTLELLLARILERVRELEIADDSTSPEYFSNLMQQVETFVDEQVFQAAAAEISSGQNRSMESVFAQRLRQILEEHCISPAA